MDPAATRPDPAHHLAAAVWPDVAESSGASLLAVPLGATEQHGPHLPLSTDSEVASELCRRLAAARSDVMVAPALPYGASGEHAAFPGTLSIGTEALETVLVELARSADAFAGVLFVSAHGGNAAAVGRAVRRLRSESRRVRSWQTTAVPGGDAHAGRTETSVMMTLWGGAVRSSAAEAGAAGPLGRLIPVLRSKGVVAVSPNGVLGDPSGASAGLGESILAAWAAELTDSVQGWP